jgi:hypothetical protein
MITIKEKKNVEQVGRKGVQTTKSIEGIRKKWKSKLEE